MISEPEYGGFLPTPEDTCRERDPHGWAANNMSCMGHVFSRANREGAMISAVMDRLYNGEFKNTHSYNILTFNNHQLYSH